MLRDGDLSTSSIDTILETILAKKVPSHSKLGAPALRKEFIQVIVEVNENNQHTRTRLQQIISDAHTAINGELSSEVAAQSLSYIPDNGFSFLIHPDAVPALMTSPDVNWVGHFQPQYKVGSLTVPAPSRRFGEESLEFAVLLAQSATSTHITTDDIASELQENLQQANIQARVQVASSRQFTLVVDDEERAEEAVAIAAALEGVSWVNIISEKMMMNNDANWILQSGEPGNLLLHDHGLKGDGVVVGISDSGADYTNCLLDDVEFPMFCESACAVRDMYKDPTCWDRYLEDPNSQEYCEMARHFSCDFGGADCNVPAEGGHRKIPVYWSFNDRLDDAVGHGTHTTGSVTGAHVNASNPIAGYHGQAPNSRVVFVDAAPNQIPEALMFPSDLAANYFPFFTRNGAHITSQSWGSMGYCDENNEPIGMETLSYYYQMWDYYKFADSFQQCGVYGIEAFDIDTYTSENDEMLVLFAAGNSGDSGYYTMGNEAVAKNAIAVGASRTSFDHLHDTTVPFVAVSNAGQFTSDEFWCGSWDAIKDLSPYSTCEEQAQAFVDAFSTDEGCCATDLDTTNQIWQLILQQFGTGVSCCIATIQETVHEEGMTGVADQLSVASFSSRGPVTEDQRLKPDFLSPGDVILSAASAPDNYDETQCDIDPRAALPGVKSMSGTSMATPHAAGAAALIQQYYNLGFSVSGERSDQGFQPSAPLMKATMINSAEVIFGHPYQDSVAGAIVALSREEGHQFVTGHGVLRLSNALHFNDEPNSPVLEAFDRQTFTQARQTWTTRFAIPADTTHFSATLVWNDPPAAMGARKKLVNDLDLVVYQQDCFELGTGNSYLGLDLLGWSEYKFSHGRFRDQMNNAERVYVANPAAGTYIVEVSAASLATASQDYSLVINYQEKGSMSDMYCPELELMSDGMDMLVFSVSVPLTSPTDTEQQFLDDLAFALSVDPTERFAFQQFNGSSIIFDVMDFYTGDARQPTADYLVELLVTMASNPNSVLFQDNRLTSLIDPTGNITVIDIVPLPPKPDDSASEVGWIVVGVCAGVLVLVLIACWYKKKQQQQTQGLLESDYTQGYMPPGQQAVVDYSNN